MAIIINRPAHIVSTLQNKNVSAKCKISLWFRMNAPIRYFMLFLAIIRAAIIRKPFLGGRICLSSVAVYPRHNLFTSDSYPVPATCPSILSSKKLSFFSSYLSDVSFLVGFLSVSILDTAVLFPFMLPAAARHFSVSINFLVLEDILLQSTSKL